MAAPIGLMERFALAEDREAVLAELIPGSEDYYFYHCLHYQNTNQLARADAILNEWVASRKGQMTALIHSMTDRQRLLTYDQSPQQTVDYFVRRLGIQLNHSPPARKGTRRFPSQLDPDFLNRERWVQASLRDNVSLSPAGLRIAAGMYLQGDAKTPISLHDFLNRVDGAYLQQLDELVIQELKSRPPREQRFGDLTAHDFLTLEELERVAQSVPAIADDNSLVNAKLRRLRPGGDVDISQQPRERREYLVEVEKYVRTLPPAYNSLKASAAYRLLEANLQFGIWDEALFLHYLSLPRRSPIISPVLERSSVRANPTDDFTEIAILPPIGDETGLVETYLEHFLRDAADTKKFERFLQADYLRRVFARTKLMAGAENPQTYYQMLSAAERQQLRDEIELRFAPQNPRRYSDDQDSELLVDVKNIETLVVRIYEMNALAYYRGNDQRLDTDVDLDGLIATHERTLQYDRPPVERHREAIALPECSGRGVWIIDLVGQGRRARTLIQRGDLQTVRAADADGMQITILDEDRNPVPNAKIYVGNQEFTAGDDGGVFLPMVSEAVDRKAIVSDGKLAKPIEFKHLQENYSLQAGFFVDHTLLQSGHVADLLVRPRLLLGGNPIDPAVLKDATVRVVATDLEGIQTSKQFDQLELNQSKELALTFRVPPRLASIEFELSGHVIGLSDRRKRELQVKHAVDVAGVRRTDQTVDAFLTRDSDSFVIETRGRSGEPVVGATVRLEFDLDIGSTQPSQYLQSDDQGQIRLGLLDHVTRLKYGIAERSQHQFDLQLNQQIWPQAVNLSTDQALRLPVVDGRTADSYRLLEIREGKMRSDLSDRLKIDNGFLTASDLPAGNLQLLDRVTGDSTQVTVIDGRVIDRVLVGKIRHQEQSAAVPLSIQDVQVNPDGSLAVQLSGNTDFARVHVIASRYFDRLSPLDDLYLGTPTLRGRGLSLARCGYVSDLRLGDEYEYVLRRQYAAKYPGVMLPQPSILLNPWETETTSNESQSAQAGDAPQPSAAPASELSRQQRGADRAKSEAAVVAPDFDFLSDAGVVVSNLIPDAQAKVTIPADVIAGMPIVRLVVADPATVLCKTVSGELNRPEVEDLRLAKALPADKPFSFERAVSVVSAEQPLDLKTLGSAQFQVYGDVASLLQLYQTLVSDSRLKEFEVLGRWNALSKQQKLDSYSELACHELHLFLRMHDPEFFNEVIRPYLANKKEKQLVDHWLLDEDLSQYASVWKYQSLSAAERALLAIRVPELRSKVRRDLLETVDLMDDDFDRQRKQIESALRSEVMFEFGALEEKEMAMGDEDADGLSRFRGRGGMGGSLGMADADAFMGLSDSLSVNSPEAAAALDAKNGRRKAAIRLQEEVRSSNRELSSRMYFGRTSGLAGKQMFYQGLDSTKQWAESHWDHVRVVGGPSPINLIPINPFWSDLAEASWQGNEGAPAVSRHLLRPTESRHAALVALAMSGLPLSAGEISLPVEPETVYRPAHPVALVTKRLRSLQKDPSESSVMIGQMFRRLREDNQSGKAATEPDRFLTGEAYEGRVVVSNPTATEQIVELFWQIPAGSLPLSGSQVTDSKTVTLAPFAVSAVQYQFYFPREGEFVHYPATVSSGDDLLAWADAKEFRVADQWPDDTVTWQSIARDGSAQQIQDYLKDANLHDLDWSLVLHRLKDRQVFDVVTDALDQVKLPEAQVWAYGFHHNDPEAMRRFLSLRDDLIARTGPVIKSTLLSIDPIERGFYEHLEYAPLVRARIHRLGDVDEILNPTFLGHYQQFVRRLGFHDSIEPTEKMPLTYYLLLQNRIEEAIKFFDSLNREAVPSQLQYDFLAGYLAMHRGDFENALAIARRHADHPVPRWNTRFNEMNLQIRQRFELMDSQQLVSAPDQDKAIDESSVSTKSADLAIADRNRANSQASATVPEVMVRVEDDSIRLDHRNTDRVDINLYGVDLELLFSKAPFARKDLQRIAMVRPTKSDVVDTPSQTGTIRIPIPEDLRAQTLLVEATVGASRGTALYYGGELTTYVSEAFGQLQTTDASTHRPVVKAYVKVYAEYPNGDIRFYKDGYTDGRGRFDYTSISAADAKSASRYSILVLSEDRGATLHEVDAP
ncbi:hypothetical protein [Roseiconus nitratireducens]|uniref:hypothetical protein n=1 Tax=Roseiconus nitratireducens TaxID=2605748 RepID=UPI001375F826|nr:hypothetical protein [Roseiconus nitratireducens]